MLRAGDRYDQACSRRYNYLMSTQPVEVLVTVTFPEEIIEPLRHISPRVRLTMQPVRGPEDIPNDVWNRTEVLYTDRLLAPVAAGPNLRWIQVHHAGVDHTACKQL